MKKRTCTQSIPLIYTLLCAVGCIASLALLKQKAHGLPSQAEATINIIFDLNDTLFTINRRKALALLGFRDIVGYLLSGKKSSDIEDMLFKVIDTLRSEIPGSSLGSVPTHKGRKLPLVMQDWMLGIITSEELIQMVVEQIELLGLKGFFANDREQRIIRKAALILFDPQTRCDLYRPISKAIKLLINCKKAGYKVYLLSNMDNELIRLLSTKYPKIFELFDGIVISAQVNSIKPHKDIYQHVLTTYNLDPARSYFIDDEQENVLGAQQVGINGIHCDYKNYKKITSAMHEAGLFADKRIA